MHSREQCVKQNLCRVINFKFCYQIKWCETACQKQKFDTRWAPRGQIKKSDENNLDEELHATKKKSLQIWIKRSASPLCIFTAETLFRGIFSVPMRKSRSAPLTAKRWLPLVFNAQLFWPCLLSCFFYLFYIFYPFRFSCVLRCLEIFVRKRTLMQL